MRSRKYLPETEKVLERLENELRDPWEINQAPTDSVIWHYTDQRGLIAIISSGNVRASNALYLNDAMEIHHARNLINDDIDNKRATFTDPHIVEFLQHIEAGAQIVDYLFQPYVACFSGEKAGDLLSQWQSYGSTGYGYAIGFIPQRLGTDASGAHLRKVVYNVTTQKRLIDEAINKYCQEIPPIILTVTGRIGIPHKVVQDFSHSITKIFHEYLYCFKHPSWEAEQEWRLVRRIVPFKTFDNVPDVEELHFRESKNGVIIPFVDLNLTEEDPNDHLMRMPISQIIIGPKLLYLSAENSVKQLLRKYDYDGVKITQSNIPLV